MNGKIEKEEDLNFYETINKLKGDSLPVSAFLDKKQGIIEPGTTKKEKRDIWKIV